MPHDQKPSDKKTGLSKEFHEFVFGKDDGPATEITKKPPPPQGPVKLTREDLDFEPYKGMRTSIPIHTDDDEDADTSIPIHFSRGGEDRDEDDSWEQQAWEETQDRTFEAAHMLFRHNHTVRAALDMLSNLEMQSVVTAGILAEHYTGRLPTERLNNMMIAALALNANNFDEICGDLQPEAVGLVDELRMLGEEPEEAVRLRQIPSLEPDSKRILLAMTAADLEMTLHEMHELGDSGPAKPEHDSIAPFIQALAPGLDRQMVNRAITAFNTVSAATDNGTTLNQTKDGTVTVSPFPDIEVKTSAPQPKSKQPSPKRRPPRP